VSGALLLRRAYFSMWEEKQCGICLTQLPFVSQTEVMTCHSGPPRSRAVCRRYQFANPLFYHMQLDAGDLPGKPKLPSEHRGRLSNDVLLLRNAGIKRSLTCSSRLVMGMW
jgi:hypothetical protein